MSTLFAFLHHLCAFTLVSAVAIEFTLIRQELTLASARRLQTTDIVLGVAAGALFLCSKIKTNPPATAITIAATITARPVMPAKVFGCEVICVVIVVIRRPVQTGRAAGTPAIPPSGRR